MKTIEIALSLALGMTAACYVGTGDELEPEIDDRGQKIRIATGYTSESSSLTISCGGQQADDQGLQLGARSSTAEAHQQQQQQPPPNAPTEQDLIVQCEMLPEIELECENICDAAGLEFTGEIGIDPGSVTYEISPFHPSGQVCQDGSEQMQQVTTATAVCACCCELPESQAAPAVPPPPGPGLPVPPPPAP